MMGRKGEKDGGDGKPMKVGVWKDEIGGEA